MKLTLIKFEKTKPAQRNELLVRNAFYEKRG